MEMVCSTDRVGALPDSGREMRSDRSSGRPEPVSSSVEVTVVAGVVSFAGAGSPTSDSVSRSPGTVTVFSAEPLVVDRDR